MSEDSKVEGAPESDPTPAHVRTRPWFRRWLVWTVAAPVALVLLVFITAERTSRSSFCITCHYMEPFYQSWQASSHHEIECIKCHYPPNIEGTIKGKLRGLYQVASYLSQAYKRSRPWAEIEDAACLRSGCHDGAIMSDTTVVAFKGVRFQHGAHLSHERRGRKLRCTSCHSQIVQGDHMVVTESTCVLCHLRAGGALTAEERIAGKNDCQVCHLAPGSGMPAQHPNIANLGVSCNQCHGKMIVGDGAVSRERCYACHWETVRLQEIGNTPALHRIHITDHNIQCLNCHSLIQHKIVQATTQAELDCGGCHPNLHSTQQALFTGIGAHDVPAMPNPMFVRGVQCKSCHIYHGNVEFPKFGETTTARSESCERCHGRGYAGLLDEWNRTIYQRVDQLRGMERTVRGRLGGGRGNARALVDSVDYNLNVVTRGKPVHNAVYAGVILDTSYALLRRAAATVRPAVRLPAFATGGSAVVPSACRSCHFDIANVTATAFGKYRFPHEPHVVREGLECTQCHENTRKHGELVAKSADCVDCHHTADAGRLCGSCHRTQLALFEGRSAVNGGEPDPDTNVHAGKPCTGCHVANGAVVSVNGRTCRKCHEEGYEETLAEWRTNTMRGVADLRTLLGTIAVNRLNASQKAQFDRAKAAAEELVADGSRGAHNGVRAESIIDEATTLLSALPKKTGA